MARAATFLLSLCLLFVGAQAQVVGSVVNNSSQLVISLFEIKVDLCYHWKTGCWPTWVLESQIPLREEYEKKYFYKNGTLMCNEDIWNFCLKYKCVILDPYFNITHYEFCWYAKYGVWKNNPIDQRDEEARRKLLKEFLYQNGRRISQREVQRLCPNYNEMNCPPCAKLKIEMCHYARYGKWKRKVPSSKKVKRFFYLGLKRIELAEILRKCHHAFDGNCKRVYYPEC